MAKSLLIFSDGTGQRGGVSLDERRSNIYKLYRATRCGPDSPINPADQLTYYDPGLGTLPPGLGALSGAWRWIYNLVSQATGLGLTANIIDCYAAIIRMWEPGDRIFLFGFSRGAYTVRCLGAALALCGVPTRMKDGKPLRRDEATARKIATEAVKKVYQHVSSPKDSAHLEDREALAHRFRSEYGSEQDGKSNAFPHFMGVFDTVASLGSWSSRLLVLGLVAISLSVASAVLWYFFGNFWLWTGVLVGLAVAVAAIAYLATHIKVAVGLEGRPWWKTLHLTDAKMKFYDRNLNENVGWARHALAIDENRAEFARVPWGSPQTWRKTQKGEPQWFEQVWFAGNHSDIGGSYPENESRLSDIALEWMVDAAQKVPGGIIVDPSVLRLFPSATGMQHDECRTGVFQYAKKAKRSPVLDAPLHPTVLERLRSSAVLDFNEMKPYRPEPLKEHKDCKSFYT